jgi:subtilisin family serine protease
MKTVLLPFIVIYVLLSFSALGFAADLPLLQQKAEALKSNPKVIEPDEIINQLLVEGKKTVRIFVRLSEPDHIRKNHPFDFTDDAGIYQGDLGNLAYRSYVKTEVAKIVGPTVSRYASHPDVEIRHTYDYLTVFSANVTMDGIAELTNETAITEVQAVGSGKLLTTQGIDLMEPHAIRNDGEWLGQHVGVAVLDTGVDYTHPRLGGGGFPNDKVVGGYDVVLDTNDPMDFFGHGTAVAGIIAGDVPPGGSHGDYRGGVAPRAKIYAVNIFTPYGYMVDDLIEGVEWCINNQRLDPNNPILVMNLSVGEGVYYGGEDNCDSLFPEYTAMIDMAVACGITVIAGSGNEGSTSRIIRPACLSSTISVGAVFDADIGVFEGCLEPQNTGPDVVACYSNSDGILDLLAPAHNAYTTDMVGSGGYKPGSYIADFGGTSAATAYASGAVACLQSHARGTMGVYWEPQTLRLFLKFFGDAVVDHRTGYTELRINLDEAWGGLKWQANLGTNRPDYRYVHERGTTVSGSYSTVEGCANFSGPYSDYLKHFKMYCGGSWWVYLGDDYFDEYCSRGWTNNPFESYYGQDYVNQVDPNYVTPGDCPGHSYLTWSSGSGTNDVVEVKNTDGVHGLATCRGSWSVNPVWWDEEDLPPPGCSTGWEYNEADFYADSGPVCMRCHQGY